MHLVFVLMLAVTLVCPHGLVCYLFGYLAYLLVQFLVHERKRCMTLHDLRHLFVDYALDVLVELLE